MARRPPICEDSWERYGAGTCPWDSARWQLWGSTAADVPVWRQIHKAACWQRRRRPKTPPCAPQMEGTFGLSVEAPSRRVSASSRGTEPADTHISLLSSSDAARGSMGEAGAGSSEPGTFFSSSIHNFTRITARGRAHGSSPLKGDHQRHHQIPLQAQTLSLDAGEALRTVSQQR